MKTIILLSSQKKLYEHKIFASAFIVHDKNEDKNFWTKILVSKLRLSGRNVRKNNGKIFHFEKYLKNN